MPLNRLRTGIPRARRPMNGNSYPNEAQNSIWNPDEDPLQNWDYQQLENEATALHKEGGFGYIDIKLFIKGAIIAQDPYAFRQSGTNFDEEEIKYLSWEMGPEDVDSKSLLNSSRLNQFRQPRALWFLVLFCSLGAVVQGWDQSVVNGAQLYYRDTLEIPSESMFGLINGAPYLCCVISCWLPAALHPFGRKGAIAFTCVVSFASCLAQALVTNWQGLLIARVFLGVGIGPNSAIIPIFASECVPEKIRGALVMCWQMWTAFGIALGLISIVGFQNLGENNWRYMLGSPLVVPFALFFIAFAQYESPRWLIQKAQTTKSNIERKRKYNEAFDSLKAFRNTPVQAARDLFHINTLLKREERWRENRNPWKDLVYIPRSRRALNASIVTMFFQQLCGVNLLAYYSSSVFLSALGGNVESSDLRNHPEMNLALWLSFGFGAINFLCSVPAIWMIDYFGRRDLLLFTFPFMALFQLLVGLSFLSSLYAKRILVPVFAYLFAIFYSVGEGPVPFVYASESLPLYTRDQGMGVITSVNWGLNFMLAMTWPGMRTSEMHEVGSFAFYAAMCVCGFFTILVLVPETKQYLLEDLSVVFGQNSTADIFSHGIKELVWFTGQLRHPWRGIEWETRPSLIKNPDPIITLNPLDPQATEEMTR